MKLLCIILVLILVFYLEQWLTILDGELRHHHACPENIAVLHYVMLVDLGEDPPIFKPPVQHLVMRPHPPLHCPLLRQIPHILGTLDFVGVSNIPLVGLNSLPRVQEMMQNFVENFDISVLTHGVGTLDPYQVHPPGYSCPARSRERISPRTFGMQMHSLLLPSPFGGHRSQSHWLS